MNALTKITAQSGFDITDVVKARHTTKGYDAAKRISDVDIAKVKELLRFSPSSTNNQPWHFVLASTDAGKARVAKGTDEKFPFNSPSIRAASHVVVFAARVAVPDAYQQKVLDQEEADGRYVGDPETQKAQMAAGRTMFHNLHKDVLQDVQQWNEKQVYLNVGQFLLGVAALGIDATPMEGFDPAALDAEFGFAEQGLTSLVIVPIGYSDAATDYNATLPKSRLTYADILTEV
ncbi:oxygen-insensitive NAD(P)H nitroreductase [Lentibacter algarum]|uniref:oxygen-insensitive NAD(P)H nitroreductase n=1 Tax=Lentibacter algarum TaxID=576131 RepID=UPI001C093A4C|nr:oxygen-insensitive NAD(P)H nitroreductase [Lentibacter algarum]MBU2982828.1 oxygen-insensitive NAD(P)H nitroreductase [Lentibacter algarum]